MMAELAQTAEMALAAEIVPEHLQMTTAKDTGMY